MRNTTITFDKTFDEIYALLVMDQIYPGVLDSVQKWESPDWKDEANLFGLEVTRAQTKHIGYTNNVVVKYLGHPKEQIPRSVLEGFQGYMEFRKGKLFLISDSKGLVNGNRHVMLLLDHLKQKLDKLNESHFSVCKHNYLFEYGTGCFSGSDKYELAQGIKDNYIYYQNIFEQIIVSTHDDVFCFSTNGTFDYHTVPVYDLTELAGKYRRAIEWKKGVLFSEAKEITSLQDYQ